MNAPTVMSDAEIDRTYRLAKALAASNFFKDARAAEQAFAKMLFGRDLGLTPTQAMTAVQIVDGKPELSANLQATFVRTYVGPDGERYDYRVNRLDDEACVLEFFRNGESLGDSTFTIDDARKAELAGKAVWKKYTRNMLFARAMSNGVAFHCPEVTGGIRVYSEGELSGDEKPPELEPAAGYGEAPLLPPPPPDKESDLGDDLPWEPEPEPAPKAEADEIDPVDDPVPAQWLMDEIKRQGGMSAQQFREFMQGCDLVTPSDLGSADKRRAWLASLPVEDRMEVQQQLVVRAQQATAA